MRIDRKLPHALPNQHLDCRLAATRIGPQAAPWPKTPLPSESARKLPPGPTHPCHLNRPASPTDPLPAGPLLNDYASVGYTLGISGEQSSADCWWWKGRSRCCGSTDQHAGDVVQSVPCTARHLRWTAALCFGTCAECWCLAAQQQPREHLEPHHACAAQTPRGHLLVQTSPLPFLGKCCRCQDGAGGPLPSDDCRRQGRPGGAAGGVGGC